MSKPTRQHPGSAGGGVQTVPLPPPTEPIDLAKAVRNLKHVGLFHDLPDEQISEVAQLCMFYWFSPGDYLIREGTAATELFILLRGEVEISKLLRLPKVGHVQGSERTLTRLPAEGNPILGETCLVSHNSIRTATVRCYTPCAVYRIPANPLQQLLHKRPQLAASVYESLARLLLARLDEASNDILKLSAALVFALDE